jgi:non-ribosomal peptide synthetase component F
MMRELTSMQSACWFGRAHAAMLGGVAAHLYTEFNGSHIDVTRLRQAIECLYRRHELLRLQLSAAGEVSIRDSLPQNTLEIDDFLHLSEAQQQQQQRARQWWQSRIAEIAPAPALPLTNCAVAGAQSTRLSTTFSPEQAKQLRQLARQHELTFSALILGLFAYSLGKVTHDAAYRLNMPFFWREPVVPDIDKTIGDFADMVLLNIDMSDAATAMIPINLAAGTYSAFRTIESMYPDIDQYVCDKLQYNSKEELGQLFSAEQIDALALAIFNHEERSRGIINADQTGIGKGRFVAGLMRYSRLNGMTPVFLTYKPSLMADIFRAINDIKSMDIFKNIFVINNTPSDNIFNPEEPLFKSMPYARHKEIIDSGKLPEKTDLVLSTYSQFNLSYEKSPKSKFLSEIASRNAFFFLDESHIAAGESNTNSNISMALENCKSVSFSSATALKTAQSFQLYKSVFSPSINTENLTEILKVGGEELQEAVANCMSEDDVLVRREHDLSNLTIRTREVNKEKELANRQIANQVAEILSMMSTLSGDIASQANEMNEEFKTAYERSSDKLKNEGKGRMQASSMNFGSRLYNVTRQFLMGLQVDETVEQALKDLENNIKPVIGVENTGESFLNDMINRNIFSAEDAINFDEL